MSTSTNPIYNTKKKQTSSVSDNNYTSTIHGEFSSPPTYSDLKGRHVRSRFQFSSDDPEELSVSLNTDLIIVDGMLDNGWIKVVIRFFFLGPS